jgi:hypothetical protein
MALVNRAANASLEAKVPFVVVLVDGKPTAEPGLKDLPVSQPAQVLSYFAPAPLLTANCIIIAPKRLKLRLSGSARKSQKRFRDTPGSNFRPFWLKPSRFHHAA